MIMIFFIFILFLLIFGWEGIIVIGALLVRPIAIIFVVICFLGVILAFKEYEDKNERDKIAEEYFKKSKLEDNQMMLEFKVWQKLTKKQKDSISKSNERSIENSKIRCVKCKRELKNVDANDYINGVGQACTECYIKDYIKKSKK